MKTVVYSTSPYLTINNGSSDLGPSFGPELWTDPPTQLGDWTDNLDGSYTLDGSQPLGTFLQMLGVGTSGQSYKIDFTVTGFAAGVCNARFGDVNGPNITANGTYSETQVLTGTDLAVRANAIFSGTVSAISMRQAL